VDNPFWDKHITGGFKMKRIIAIVMVLLLAFAGIAIAEKAYTPSVNDKFDLGTDKLQYKDIKLGGSIVIEGATHNAYETTISVTDPTADRTVTLQNASGTVMYTTDAYTGSLADGKILVGTNAGGGIAAPVTPSGDWTITNAGVATIGANKINVGKAFINAVTLTVSNTASAGRVTVDPGHVLMGDFLTTVGGINGLNMVNDPIYEGAGVWAITMVNALSGGDAVWTLNFLSDN
jgi:hypothetical protein